VTLFFWQTLLSFITEVMVRTRKQSDESDGVNGMVVSNEYEEGSLTSIHSVASVRRPALRVQEVKEIKLNQVVKPTQLHHHKESFPLHRTIQKEVIRICAIRSVS